MQSLTVDFPDWNGWTAGALHARIAASLPGEFLSLSGGVLVHEDGSETPRVTLYFADKVALPDPEDVRLLIGGVADPEPAAPVSELEALKARLDKLESDVSILKGA